MIGDTGELSGYWPVAREAQAMLEDMIPGQLEMGEQERRAIRSNPQAPASLKRWAECYFRGNANAT
jgi:hypothetical protein